MAQIIASQKVKQDFFKLTQTCTCTPTHTKFT